MKFKIILLSILLSSCGRGETPYSQTRDYLSFERQLYITPGEGGGYCAYNRDRSGEVTLITERGALSADQLGQSLSFMSHWSQAVSAGLLVAAHINAILNRARNRPWLWVRIGGLALWGSAGAVNGLYRIIKGNYEGEKGDAIAAQFFSSWLPPANFIVEEIQRRGRLESLANKHVRVSISRRKMNRIIAKLSKKKPAFPDACP